MPIPQAVTAILPCKDDESAALFAAYVNTYGGTDWATADGRNVAVKTTDMTAGPFLDMIALHATEQDWTRGIEMVLAVADFLESLPVRTQEA